MKYAIYSKEPLAEVILSKFKGKLDYEKPDFVFSFGGDGTMLNAVNQYIDKIDKTIFVGINTGKLGFYTDFVLDELDSIITAISKGEVFCHEFFLLQYSLIKDTQVKKGYALNEIAVTNPIHTQIIEVYINDKMFETFRGTGLLVSTPSGSTGYNKSLGGSVMDSSIEAIQLTEIAAINNRVFKSLASPLIIPKNNKVSMVATDSDNIYISVDGRYEEFKGVEKIDVKLSSKKVKMLGTKDYSFYNRVKKSFIE
ncbi:MAG: NAD kinase [Bacilli bacterium]|jgi:NAD+ kinase